MTIPTTTLNNGVTMPRLGFGTWRVGRDAVATALETGYRCLDTAEMYRNETDVAAALAASGLDRAEVFVTTKVWNDHHGRQSTLDAFHASRRRLGLDVVDLYLIHWPAGEQGKYVDSWGGFLKIREDGLTRSIGVSNFDEEYLSDIIDLSFVTPAVNQIELHPLLNQADLRKVHAERNVLTQAYSPLGVGNLLADPTIGAVAQAHGKSPAQVLLRWNLQLGNAVVVRSSNPDRMRENLAVFDFELTDDEMNTINGMDNGTRYRPDPRSYTG